MKTICVFCSSSNDVAEKYNQLAKDLGRIIGENKLDLIHGGGIIGLMGHLLRSAIAHGSNVTGVVPEGLNRPSITNEIDQRLIITKDMKDRKEYMRNNSNAFIVLPGGFGTLEEALEVITLKQLRYHNKPIVLLNAFGHYNFLLQQFEILFEQKFTDKSYSILYQVEDKPCKAIEYIKNYRPVNINDKYLDEK